MYMNRLAQKYQDVVVPALEKEFGKTNVLSIARPKKVVVNVGISKKDTDSAKHVESIIGQLAAITGQKPKVCSAKKSIAGFKMREGDAVGVCVTLRGTQMWEFLDKLIAITLPRMKDFQGVSKKHIDSAGNYNLGISEQIVFPEVNYDKVTKMTGVQVTIVNKTDSKEEGLKMLELLGMPFEKENNK